ncbi:MAG: hypothetical protein IH855_06665 [Bacteroidetes bacterium]|nr:hypothetical protein [Bacteroidota bacterium]
MTQLLQKALARLKRLPETEQDFYARQIIGALDGDARWESLFDGTTEEQWAKLNRMADDERGETISLDEFLARAEDDLKYD